MANHLSSLQQWSWLAVSATLVCGCTPKEPPKALHHAAIAARVALEQGSTPDEASKQFSALKVEFESAKADLSTDAASKCDKASSVSESYRRIFSAIASHEAQGYLPDGDFAELKPDLKNIGLLTNESRWNEWARMNGESIPADSDTDSITSLKARLRLSIYSEILKESRGDALQLVRACETATGA
jgi:hypothetical protein